MRTNVSNNSYTQMYTYAWTYTTCQHMAMYIYIPMFPSMCVIIENNKNDSSIPFPLPPVVCLSKSAMSSYQPERQRGKNLIDLEIHEKCNSM